MQPTASPEDIIRARAKAKQGELMNPLRLDADADDVEIRNSLYTLIELSFRLGDNPEFIEIMVKALDNLTEKLEAMEHGYSLGDLIKIATKV